MVRLYVDTSVTRDFLCLFISDDYFLDFLKCQEKLVKATVLVWTKSTEESTNLPMMMMPTTPGLSYSK